MIEFTKKNEIHVMGREADIWELANLSALSQILDDPQPQNRFILSKNAALTCHRAVVAAIYATRARLEANAYPPDEIAPAPPPTESSE